MQTTKELFAIPFEDKHLLYAPLKGTALEVERGVLGFLGDVDRGLDPIQLDLGLTIDLLKMGVLEYSSKSSTHSCSCDSGKNYVPTSVTLLPTFDCNLRCVYCYARAGEDVGEVMRPEIAKASIDLIAENAVKSNIKKLNVSFHGGGEPLLPKNRDLIDYAINYARLTGLAKGLQPTFNVVTNGVHSEKTLEWAVDNFGHINLSFDGPEDIQNSQRPLPNGGSSFGYIMKTLKYFETIKKQRKFDYGLRATITANSVRRMPEILEFFTSISSNKSFHLEPLFECGRCSTTQFKAPDPHVFLEEMIKTEALAKKLGVQVYYSGASIDKIGETFCGACGSNFFVTPNGFVTTCLEACREEDAVSNVFFIGKYNASTRKFDFDNSKLETLRKRKVSAIGHCEDCFAKYNCCGDCPAKVYESSGDLMDPSKNARCVINQGLLKHRLGQELIARRGKPLEVRNSGADKKC